jgi:Family of unknown function (DUF6461)
VQFAVLDRWTIDVEPNGYQGCDEDVVIVLSRGGRAVSLYWNVNHYADFIYAVDGVVVRAFDPVLPDIGPRGDPLPQESALSFEQHPLAATLLLTERLAGVVLDEAWLLATPRQTWTVRR